MINMIFCIFVAVLFLSNILWMSSASIAGVTYMDNFDFEQRYKNIDECNPFYWHPLHLPDHCTEIFKTAILSHLKSNVPIRLVKEKKGEIIEMISPYDISSSFEEKVPGAPISTEISYGHPFGKMLELLSRDVKDHPRAPTVGFLPNVGLVALYQQPISRKSEKIIKKVATIYAPDLAFNEPQYSPLSMNTPWNNMRPTEQNDVVKLKRNKSKRRPKFIKKKIKNGDAVAILKKKIYK